MSLRFEWLFRHLLFFYTRSSLMAFKHRRGSALVEFIFVLPVLCTILLATVEFGLMLFDKNVLVNASRAGARYGIIPQNGVYPSSSNISSYIQNTYVSNLVSFGSPKPVPTITIATSVNPPVKGATLTVTITYSYKCLIIASLLNTPCPVVLTTKTVMAYE